MMKQVVRRPHLRWGLLILPILLTLSSFTPSFAEEEPSRIERMADGYTQLWVNPGFSAVTSDDHTYSGLHLGLGIQFQSEDQSKMVFGASIQHPFDGERVNRFDFSAHMGYLVLPQLQLGVLLGAEYLDIRHSKSSHLKPLLGVEGKWKLIPTRYGFIALMVNYRVAQGSTGTMLIDGGSDGTSGKLFSIGASYSFRLFEE